MICQRNQAAKPQKTYVKRCVRAWGRNRKSESSKDSRKAQQEMLKYLLFVLILSLYLIPYGIKSYLSDDMIYHVYVICMNLIPIILALAMLKIQSFGKRYKGALIGMVTVASLWFAINYISVIVTDVKYDFQFVRDSDNG